MFRSPASSSRVLVLIAIMGVARAPAQTPIGSATEAEASGPKLRVFDPSLIDKTMDPCENFYRYSCNQWFKRNPLPPDQISYGRFTELREQNRLYLKQILEQSAIPAPTRTANEQKIGDEYASCMDTATIDKLGIAPLQPELDRIARDCIPLRSCRRCSLTCTALA